MARPHRSVTSVFVVGSGPSELDAYLDLDRRLSDTDAAQAWILDVAHCDGHWSAVATISPDSPV